MLSSFVVYMYSKHILCQINRCCMLHTMVQLYVLFSIKFQIFWVHKYFLFFVHFFKKKHWSANFYYSTTSTFTLDGAAPPVLFFCLSILSLFTLIESRLPNPFFPPLRFAITTGGRPLPPSSVGFINA